MNNIESQNAIVGDGRGQLLMFIERRLMECHDDPMPDWSWIASTILDEVERCVVAKHHGEVVYADDNVACIDKDTVIPTTVVLGEEPCEGDH